LASVQARIAADGAKFGAQGNAESLAKAASQAERQAVLQSAQATLAIRRHALADAEAKPLDDKNRAGVIQAAQNQVTEAQKAVDSAQAELAAESSKYTPLSPVYPTRSSGRRKALAEWIASPQNPLTARVAVNHVWMRHFGRPLAASVTDFGRNGKAPTHPNLIDWLACELMEHGWSMKRLHRLIVTSNTYRQASGQRSAVSDQQTAKGNLQLDTDNRYYWRFPQRRVEAEVVRDSLLHAAGQIDGQLGGQPLENNLEPTARRRSLYFAVYPEDGGNMKFLEQFDAPDACDCYRRTESLIPQQALALTNSRITMDMSRLLARKLWAEASAREPIEELRELSLVIAAFEQILTRRPTSAEQAICIDFLHKQAELFRGADPKQPAVLTPSGAVPPAADPVQRACESLINSLFSHTEFVTMK
jgi:hypothetical protein